MSATCTNAVSPDGKYIIQKIVGEINTKMALEFDREAHALGRRLGINRYLTDATECRNVASVIENYYFAYKDISLTFNLYRSARVALLVDPEDRSHDFVETACRNAGFDVTIFRDWAEAIRYLVKE